MTVTVDEPVKFIAKYAETDGNTSIYPIADNASNLFCHTANAAHASPNKPPLKENARPGINGNSKGVTNVPANTAPAYAMKSTSPNCLFAKRLSKKKYTKNQKRFLGGGYNFHRR